MCALRAQPHLKPAHKTKWICAHLDPVSGSGCKSLANSRVHKHTEVAEIKIQNFCSERVCTNTAWDMLRHQHMETETKTEAETGKERDWPNINTTHAVIWPSPHTHTQAAAAKITLTCPHFHLNSSMAKSTLFPKQEGCQRKGRGAKLTLTGSMDSPGGPWHSAMTGPCLGLNKNM